MSRPVVLVHGAFHGPWCWDPVTPMLDAAGIAWRAPELRGPDLHGDADTVCAALDVLGAADGDVVLVGHSYGGAVVTDAGAHPSVGRIVYLAAVVPDAGEPVGAAGGAEAAAHWASPDSLGAFVTTGADGMLHLDRAALGPQLYGDCDARSVAWASERLRPQSPMSFAQAPRSVAWRERPSTYVICTLDRAVPPAVQRILARRCDDVVEWEASHSPFASMPQQTAEFLVDLAR